MVLLLAKIAAFWSNIQKLSKFLAPPSQHVCVCVFVCFEVVLASPHAHLPFQPIYFPFFLHSSISYAFAFKNNLTTTAIVATVVGHTKR